MVAVAAIRKRAVFGDVGGRQAAGVLGYADSMFRHLLPRILLVCASPALAEPISTELTPHVVVWPNRDCAVELASVVWPESPAFMCTVSWTASLGKVELASTSCDDPAAQPEVEAAVASWRWTPVATGKSRKECKVQTLLRADAVRKFWVGFEPDHVATSTVLPEFFHTYAEMKPKSRVSPPFPAGADGLTGADLKCSLSISVDKRGIPTGARALHRCHPAVSDAAMEAAGQWRFYPAYEDGKPVAERFPVTFVFKPPNP